MRSQPSGGRSTRSRDIGAASRYLWHLEPDWTARFAHDHWWTGSAAAAPQEAVVWEVLRRHPTTKRLIDSRGVRAPASLKGCPYLRLFFAKHGLKSWQMLSSEEREGCLEAVSVILPQRGVIPSTGGVGEIGAPDDADRSIFAEIRRLSRIHADSLVRGDVEDAGSIDRAEELWNQVHLRVFHCIRQGHVLISFDPLMPRVETKVAESIQRIVALAQTTGTSPKSRARCEDWLNAIDRFETVQLRPGRNFRRDDQLFATYRRIFDGFIF